MKHVKIITILFFFLVIQVSFGEIITSQEINSQETKNIFIVNKYYPTFAQEISHIVIQPQVYEATMSPCSKANFSFKLTNPGFGSQLYSFAVKDFHGTAYITNDLLLAPKESKVVEYILSPECSVIGDINPRIVVQTEEEQAEVPTIIHIQGTFIDENSCEYYYNESICNSEDYIKFSDSYKIDLSRLFYDPDGDKLGYTATDGQNIDISINKNIATLKPKNGWSGAEELVFSASDGKGGFAESRKFYIQVTKSKGFFSRLYDWLFK